MKLWLFFWAFWEVSGGSIVDATTYSTGLQRAYFDGANLEESASSSSAAMTELWQGDAESAGLQIQQHQLLLRRLHQDEAMELQAKHALENQQKMLVQLQRQQEALELHERAYEAKRVRLLERSRKRVLPDQSLQVQKLLPNVSKVGPGAAMMIDYKQTDKEYWDEQNEVFYHRVVFIASYMFQVCIVALLYHEWVKRSFPLEYKVNPQEVQPDEFQFGAFDASGCCSRDLQICMCSFFCTFVRWADTASNPKIGFLEFYPAVFISALLSCVSAITFGTSMPILLLIAILLRQRIRRAYNLPSGTCGSLCSDCLLWFFCPCCAACQEARQVEYVDPDTGYYQAPFEDSYP
jgi:Cys-rich protein (TIGR01571 family)